MMSLSPKQIKQLEKIISSATQLLKEAKTVGKSAGKAAAPRKRRSGKELIAFRKMLKSELANGVSAAHLSKTHGVSTAYIYQFAGRKLAKAGAKTASAKASSAKKASAKKSAAGKQKPKKMASKRRVAPKAAPTTETTEQGV